MLDIILLAFLGVGGGVLTGLIPGIHPNSLAAFAISISAILLALFTPHAVIVFIIAMAISHTFLSFVPSVFLGMPEGETALSVLPGHRLLLEGRGYEAVYLTVIGGVGVVLLTVLLLPFLGFALPVLYESVRIYIPYVLIFIALLMILTERGYGKIKAAFVFMLAGLLGILTLSPDILNSLSEILTLSPAFSSQHILFPVFTGLFGLSTLILSYISGVKIPPQKTGGVFIEKAASVKGILKGFFSGMVVGILPGIGPSQAGVVVHQFTGGRNLREFLIALGGINTVAALFSLMALYLISKPRSGVAIAVERIVGTLGFPELLLLVATAMFATGIAAILALKITRHFALFIQRVNYRMLLMVIMIFLVGMTLLLAGLSGLLVLATATGIGMLPPLFGVKRTHAMAVLMVPIILWIIV
jgi:putative membrane protein